ncbi:MAG: YchJ family protein [Thalassotalea sp.]
MQCPCQSNKTFSQCCQPYLTLQTFPTTPEQLMRSRYSAYVTKNIDYIVATYSPEVRKQQNSADIKLWADSCRWINLIIHQTAINEKTAQTGEVEFSAIFIENNQLCLMREKSNFIKIAERWYYHDGLMVDNQVFAKIKRNEPCPCQQGKKYKQCCGNFII